MSIKSNFNHCESLYWVFTQLCNDQCDHCYNLSGPHGTRISTEECLLIIDNFPDRIDRLILSGGEPLADWKKLLTILDKIQKRYGEKTQVMLQTNGDLLNEEKLDILIEKGITRFDIASIDRYHKAAGGRLMELADLFDSRGVDGQDKGPLIDKEKYVTPSLSWGYWGATEDMWLGGNWARGRAMQKNLWLKDHKHNFCSVLSGGIGFLGGKDNLPQEISIQLWAINPCCPGTKKAMGDARKEKVSEVLSRVAGSPVFRKINDGDPYGMGESIGISREYAETRGEQFQNICRWCDEFFDRHYDMEKLEKREKSRSDR